ncbi:DUF397 domain-containing protein [Streptomyces caniferus]|uniref:DUF397 domain-containing protein n=1 Tax=Streptomyces caniferus TaxID=285557 RepID=UPI001357E7F8|nr:DUF397 domain-containing protein [Streptomyces caniferus]
MSRYDLATAQWRKSSYSSGASDNCLEVSDSHPGIVPVRDSKTPHGPALAFPAAGWASFVDAVKNSHFTGA